MGFQANKPNFKKIDCMSTYADLAVGRYYLITENQGEELILIQPMMETSLAIFSILHDAGEEITYWRKKTDPIAEILEELSDEEALAYELMFDEDEADEDWEDD
jgi:mevalonate pyrophosphate decarboxylase